MSLNAMWPLLRAVPVVHFPAGETPLMQQNNASRGLGSSYPLTDSVFYAYTLSTIVAVNLLFVLPGCKPRLQSEIPYDHSNPIVYDNDSSEDTYTDELLMALHTAGRIELRGMITTVGGWRDPWEPTDLIARHQISERSELVSKARRSGMTRVPLPVAGPSDSIAEPPSGHIEDTTQQRTGAAKLIVAEAALASDRETIGSCRRRSGVVYRGRFSARPQHRGPGDRRLGRWQELERWGGALSLGHGGSATKLYVRAYLMR